MNYIAELTRQFVRDEDGQDVVEYGLLIACIAIGVLLATAAFGTQLKVWWSNLAGGVTTAGCALPPGADHASHSGLEHGHAFQCP